MAQEKSRRGNGESRRRRGNRSENECSSWRRSTARTVSCIIKIMVSHQYSEHPLTDSHSAHLAFAGYARTPPFPAY